VFTQRWFAAAIQSSHANHDVAPITFDPLLRSTTVSVILYEQRDGIAFVTLNRPEKHNAYTPEMFCRLADLWQSIAVDPAVRVVLLTGAGGKAFSTGGDLGHLVPLSTGARTPEDEWDRRWVDNHQALVDGALLRNVPFYKPVVAAINGLAVAGGFEFMLSTDIRVASRQSSFRLSEVRRGIIPSGGSLTRLARQIGWVNAMEIILAAEPVSAERVHSMGLINRVVEADEVMDVALEYCAAIAQGAPLALAKAKEAIVRSSGLPLAEGFLIEQASQEFVMATEDAREGPRAFMERRPARFIGA
jgi:enoyl-CoA hydratase